ncbi:MAG TPA: prolyl oligopeptidase family serine peptidase [Candidatus Acidoferrales bacterium]|nr:prolyl oligopeptidase family serine peptidase [Candidatus Acidoferrales bacterium]
MESYSRTGVPPWGSGTDIYIQNIVTGAERNLTGGDNDNWLPSWSPNGRYLAFLSDRGGSGQARLWIWDALRDKLRKVSDVSVRGNEIEWTRDNQELLVTTLPQGLIPKMYVGKLSSGTAGKTYPDSEADRPTVFVYGHPRDSRGGKRSPESDPWDLDQYLRDLIFVDIHDGKIHAVVLGQKIAAYSLSPDGSRIAYTVPMRFGKPGSQQVLFDLAIINRSTDRKRVVASGIRLDPDGASFSWSPNSRKLAFTTGGMEERVHNCYVVDLDQGTVRDASTLPATGPRPRHKSAKPLWDETGQEMYFIHDGALWRVSPDQTGAQKVAFVPHREITRLIGQKQNLLWTVQEGKATIVVTHDDSGKQDGFYRIDLKSGESTELLEKGQCYTCANLGQLFTVTGSGQRIAYVAEDARHDEDLWVSDARFQTPRRLTHLNPQFDKYKMGGVRLISWLDDDGEPSHGLLLLPPTYTEGVRYPLVVWVYGGALLSNDFDHFGLLSPGVFNMQLLATRGYAVLLPDTFLHAGTPMLDMAKTVLPGVNKVIDMGIADPKRLGVMGHSFGGLCTLFLVVETNRFRAGIDMSGFGDLLSNYGAMGKDGTAFGMSIEEQGQASMGGTPWQVRERYLENSPILYFDRIETPLLIIHGSKDTTVAPFLADEVFVDLRRLGKTVEYAKYQGEGHSPLDWSFANKMDLCNRVIDWLNEYLKN